MQAEQWTSVVSNHGEGPVWWPATGELRLLDMQDGAIVCLDADANPTRIEIGSRIAACLRPRAGGGAILARENDFAIADAEDLSDLRQLVMVFDDPKIRFNEGSADPLGGFYCGTMAYQKTEGAAKLYHIDPDGGEPVVVRENLTTSNGLAFSPNHSLAYFNDTPTLITTVFDYADGELRNPRPFVQHGSDDGSPDGLCVDSEGGVWVAMFRGSQVRRYAADGKLSEVVELPASQVTACTFGGTNLDRLFITTSARDISPQDEPAAGAVFVFEPGITGLAPLPYAG